MLYAEVLSLLIIFKCRLSIRHLITISEKQPIMSKHYDIENRSYDKPMEISLINLSSMLYQNITLK